LARILRGLEDAVRHSNDHKNVGREHEQEWECDKVKGVEENELCREDANREEKMLHF
jgi:hypothetical protein